MKLKSVNKLYIFCGIPFSGKTTLAKKIEQVRGFKRIDLDDVKFDLFGKDIKDSDINQDGWDKVYQEMYRQIKESLSKGTTVLSDTGNFTRSERELVGKIADRLGIETITVFVDIPAKIARERLLQNRQANNRFDVSDEDFESTVKEMEPPDDDEPNIVYTFGESVEEWIKKYFD